MAWLTRTHTHTLVAVFVFLCGTECMAQIADANAASPFFGQPTEVAPAYNFAADDSNDQEPPGMIEKVDIDGVVNQVSQGDDDSQNLQRFPMSQPLETAQTIQRSRSADTPTRQYWQLPQNDNQQQNGRSLQDGLMSQGAQWMNVLDSLPPVQAVHRFTTALVSQNQPSQGGADGFTIVCCIFSMVFSLLFFLWIPCGIPPLVRLFDDQMETFKEKWAIIVYKHKPGGPQQGHDYTFGEIMVAVVYYLLKIRSITCKGWLVPYFSEKPEYVLQPPFMSGPRRFFAFIMFIIFFAVLA